MKELTDVWNHQPHNNLQVKLKKIKRAIKEWNIRVNDNIDNNISDLEKEQFQADEKGLDDKIRDNISNKLISLYKTKQDMLRQKSRFKWHLHGDKNSKFLHNMIKYRWKKNQILSLWWRSAWLFNESNIKEAFVDHFSSFCKEKYSHAVFNLGNLQLSKLSTSESSSLIKDFMLAELDKTLEICSSGKAPGPDGLSFGTIKKLWKFIRTDTFNFVSKFHSDYSILGGLNSSFIVLIPKGFNPTKVSDFRPISLINSCMKLLSKMLAERLKRVLLHLISDTQSGFMRGRQISDGILLASEVVSSLKANKSHSLILKIDFKKAFDTVNWSFFYIS